MTEIEAISKIEEALSGLMDEEERSRVLNWANSKYGSKVASPRLPVPVATQPKNESWVNSSSNAQSVGLENEELPGIAIIDTSGNFRLTVRDIKARSGAEAAKRLALVTIHSYCLLTGEPAMSSKRYLKPILEDWRVYNGNTRGILAKYSGIIRNGDMLSLDFHAKKEAETIIREILDDAFEGSWNPSSNKKKGLKERPKLKQIT